MKKAFTLLEVLISVLILSTAFIIVLQIHKNTSEEIIYITSINNHTLSDTLFVSPSVIKYNKSQKTAYDVINDKVHIKKIDSKEILKNIKRNIYIPDIKTTDNTIMPNIPPIEITEIKLKDNFSSRYFHFSINSL